VRAGRSWAAAPAPLVVAFSLVCGVILLSISLMPPFLYDSLWYHLAAPQIFIKQHRFLPLPQLGQANFPFAVEMLYTVGLLLGTDSASAVLEFACGAGLVVATWSFAHRWFSRRIAWIAVAALLTASEVQKLAAVADIDLALTFFQFLALYAALAWIEDRRPGWLVVCAGMSGLAAGSKYTALVALVPLVTIVLTAEGIAWRRLLTNSRPALMLLAGALLVASPWYIKNLMVYHNPVYPLLAALPPNQLVASAARSPVVPAGTAQHGLVAILVLPLRALQSGSYLSLTGRSLGDYLQVPFQVFARGDLDMYGHPSLLFVLTPLALFAVRRPVVIRLMLVAAVESIVWSVGPQELRYLVPTFPIYAVLGAVGFDWLAQRAGSPSLGVLRLVLPIVVLLSMTLYEDGYVLMSVDPLPVLAGVTSRDAFLGTQVSSYNADKFLAKVLLPGQRVLAFGEVRSYYAEVPIIFDYGRDMPTRIFVAPGSPQASAALLKRARVAYLLMEDIGNVDQAPFAPLEAQRELQSFQQFETHYLSLVFSNADVRVYRFTPDGEAG
jgi:4-amino-4-deoxy-L-arabinose transferase-like glycosyltransferase